MRSARLIVVSSLFASLVAVGGAQSPAATDRQSSPVSPLGASGADIGAKVNGSFAALPQSGGTVRIPAGSYTFTTTIKLTHAGQHLVCDAGAVLHYTGNEDAILIDPGAGGSQGISIDGEGGCQLTGTPQARNGIELMPGNTLLIRNMRIVDFPKGNGIELSGANSVQILSNVINRCNHAIDMVTVPHYAPNAVHVANNEIAVNGWGIYSRDGHVPASRALGNVYRDNVFEGNTIGDLALGWDAHTVVEGNYFESLGVAIAAGAATANVYDIHIIRNYFTTNGKSGYRSEVELGYGFGFFIEGNYEEGPSGPGTGCSVNAIPGPNGGTTGVVLRNAFSRLSEGKISAHEFCYKGSPIIPPGVLGTTRLAGSVDIDGDVQAKSGDFSGPVKLGRGAVTSTDMALRAGEGCTPEGTLAISAPAGHAAQLFFCSGGHWQSVVPPRP